MPVPRRTCARGARAHAARASTRTLVALRTGLRDPNGGTSAPRTGLIRHVRYRRGMLGKEKRSPDRPERASERGTARSRAEQESSPEGARRPRRTLRL